MAEAEAAADVEEALDEAHARRACEAGGVRAAGTDRVSLPGDPDRER